MKGKTTISLFTLVLFVIFQISCSGIVSTTRQIESHRIVTFREEAKLNLKILALKKKSGEKIVFSERDTVHFVNEGIQAKILVFDTKEVDRANVKERRKIDKHRYILVTKDGKTIEHTSFRLQKNKLLLNIPRYVTKTFPYADIRYINVKYDAKDVVGPQAGYFLAYFAIGLLIFGGASLLSYKPCIFKTTLQGTNHESYLMALRNFRDTYLKSTKKGRALVALYYKYSPVLARLIRRDQGARTAVRLCLIPIGEFCSVVMAARNRNS